MWRRLFGLDVVDGPRHEHAMDVLADIHRRHPVDDLPAAFTGLPTGHVLVHGSEARRSAARPTLPPVAPIFPTERRATVPVGHRPRPARVRRPDPLVGALATLVAAVLLLGTAIAAWPSRDGSRTADGTTPPTTASAMGGVPTSAVAPPSAVAVRLVRTGTTTASVAVAPEAVLSMTAVAPCWIRVRDADGQIAFQGTLQAREARQVPVAPGATLRVGSSKGVNVLLDGVAVELPGAAGVPFDVRFVAG